ncbi:MAG: trigger factor [Peptoclostridium sp.]|uniref:trigger factor n=1 Tax=Peptoclostridium sp. TaxID=1904860 RepID=UPI00139ED1D0|nr:trigger factor [Peptoclostridium sp.]MZQ76393.1 trigger factor [Peptoclostridium sp.]
MSSELVKKEKSNVVIKLVVESKDFQAGVDKAYNKLRGRFHIPGFRKGKAPKQIIELNYGKGIFYEDAINIVFPAAYDAAVKELGLDPVAMPEIDEVEQIGDGQDLVMLVNVTVKPEVELGEYKGIEVEKKEAAVGDEEVLKDLEIKRENNARYVNVSDRGVQDGDMLAIDFKGFVDGAEFQGGSAENYSLVVGSNTFIPGFEEQLIGAALGSDVDVNVEFPADYQSEELAGKPALFKVKINEIKYKELPELDDEFAKDVSEFDTLDELKADIKSKLQEDANKKVESEMKNAMVEKVVEAATVEVPEVMVDAEAEAMMKDFEMQLRYQGLDMDTYVKFVGKNRDEMKDEMKEQALKNVKRSLVLEKIYKTEGIEINEEEFDKELEEMAKLYSMDLEKVKKTLRPQDITSIKESMLVKKTVEMLYQNAKIA